MSHDTHFLTRLERLSPRQTDWAMSLYRNAPLVKEIVATMAPTKTRVAIAIDDTAEPAHVLVESTGAFVTCLASGMRHDLPVITRSAVEQAAKDRKLLRELLEEEKTRGPRAAFRRLVERLENCRLMSRETAVELRAWSPVLVGVMLKDFTEIVQGIYSNRRVFLSPEKLKPRHGRDVREHWLRAWRLGHLSALCAEPLRGDFSRSTPASVGQSTGFSEASWIPRLAGVAQRGMWTVADMAYETIDDQESAYLHDGEVFGAYPAAYSLVMTALRVPALRARVEGIVKKDFVCEQPLDEDDRLLLARLRQVLADPKAALLRHLESARSWADEHLPNMELDDKQVLAASLYAPHVLFGTDAFCLLADMLPFVAASAYEDLYLPEEVLATWPADEDDSEAFAYAEALRAEDARLRPPPAPRQPGRNEPCHCGSGRKYKKCHGGG